MGPLDILTFVEDGPLGRTTMSRCRPRLLAGLVDQLWHSDGVVVSERERVLPNGMLELVLALGSPHRFVVGEELRPIPAASFSGVSSGPFVLAHPARCDTLGIVLRPAAAWALLQRPLSDLLDLTVDARDLLGAAVEELIERCDEARSVAERFAVVEDWLAQRILGAVTPDPAIAWMLTEIERTGAQLRVGTLREATGISKTRLVARFREQVGVRPKLYARLVRFRRVLEQLRGAPLRLTDIALDTGYYDQAHMNADFREFAGLSPTQFLAARFADGAGNTAREPG